MALARITYPYLLIKAGYLLIKAGYWMIKVMFLQRVILCLA